MLCFDKTTKELIDITETDENTDKYTYTEIPDNMCCAVVMKKETIIPTVYQRYVEYNTHVIEKRANEEPITMDVVSIIKQDIANRLKMFGWKPFIKLDESDNVCINDPVSDEISDIPNQEIIDEWKLEKEQEQQQEEEEIELIEIP